MNLLPSMQLLMVCIAKYFEFHTLISYGTMTSRLQPTQVQGLCYTRGIHCENYGVSKQFLS